MVASGKGSCSNVLNVEYHCQLREKIVLKQHWPSHLLQFIYLGPVQTSNFTCAEPNTNLGQPK